MNSGAAGATGPDDRDIERAWAEIVANWDVVAPAKPPLRTDDRSANASHCGRPAAETPERELRLDRKDETVGGADPVDLHGYDQAAAPAEQRTPEKRKASRRGSGGSSKSTPPQGPTSAGPRGDQAADPPDTGRDTDRPHTARHSADLPGRPANDAAARIWPSTDSSPRRENSDRSSDRAPGRRAAPRTRQPGRRRKPSRLDALRFTRGSARRSNDHRTSSDAAVDRMFDDHFIPEPPPPLPRGNPVTWLAWIGVIGGPITLLLLAVLWRNAPTTIIVIPVIGLLGGFLTLVARLPRGRPDDEDRGDGAVV